MTDTEIKPKGRGKPRPRKRGESRRPSGGDSPSGGEIIHVRFGDRGGRIPPPPPAPAPPEPSPPGREPVTDVFSVAEVSKLLGVPESRLRSLSKSGIVPPSGAKRGRPAYTFQDLIALRAAALLGTDVKLRDVVRAIDALRASLPKVTRPLQELRIVSDGSRLVVRTQAGAFEPLTGQFVLDFRVEALRDEVVRVLRPDTDARRKRTAYDLYLRASALDEDPATLPEAESLYARALELDPTLSIAHTNLGNIKYRRAEIDAAEAHYLRALSVDEHQAEAHYNLGYVALERGEYLKAVHHFDRALAADPEFSDAHFNLAMALEHTQQKLRAKAHWLRYLELEPNGSWSEVAREHL